MSGREVSLVGFDDAGGSVGLAMVGTVGSALRVCTVQLGLSSWFLKDCLFRQ